MGSYTEIKGDLIELALAGEFDVIAHGVNCFSKQKRGLAPQMAKAFGTDKFEMEQYVGFRSKLGIIDGRRCQIASGDLWVLNAYTQYDYRNSDRQQNLDYDALTTCLKTINKEFPGMRLGIPQIGAGLAGGNWETIKLIIHTSLPDVHVTVVIYNK